MPTKKPTKKVIPTVKKSVEKSKAPRQKTGPKKKDPLTYFLPKLERWLILGYSITQACTLSGLPDSTISRYMQEDSKFRSAVELLMEGAGTKARANIVNSIQKGSIEDSWKWLERKSRAEFATRTENTGKDGEPLSQPMEVVFIGKDKTK